MSKRVCQTCRHFRAAGFDNMGWCNHPKRNVGSEVKLLARSLELQCRNDWDHDLWQGFADGESPLSGADHVVSPMRPATVVEIARIAASGNRPRPDRGFEGEDVVVAEVTQTFSVNKAAAQGDGFKVGISKAHEELKARHKAVREIVLPAPGFADIPALKLTEDHRRTHPEFAPATDEEDTLSNQQGAHSRPIIGEVSPVALGEIGRPFPKMTTFPEDDEIFSSIPKAVEGFDLPLAIKPTTDRIVRRAGFDEEDRDLLPWNHGSEANAHLDVVSSVEAEVKNPVVEVAQKEVVENPFLIEPLASSDRVIRREQTATPVAEDVEVWRHEERVPRRSSRGEFDLSVFGAESAVIDSAIPVIPERLTSRRNVPAGDVQGRQTRDYVIESLRAVDRDELVLEERSVLRQTRSRVVEEPAGVAEVSYNDSLFEEAKPVRLPRTKRSVEAAPYMEQTGDLQTLVPEQDVSLPQVSREDVEIAPRVRRAREHHVPVMDDAFESDPVGATPEASIPRMCKTCRDFRPAESGERGWCTNKWAFNHRRMVDAEELPCETTIGRWWLPHDDHWANTIDISAHARPTPHLDQWLAQRAELNGEIDSAQPIRRRQRS